MSLDLPLQERPREKLCHYGPEKLSNAELLAIILRTGQKGQNVLSLARELFKKFPAERWSQLQLEQLLPISGLGISKASQIVAGLELAKRLLLQKPYVLLLKPQDVWEELGDIRASKKEHFVVFYLDSRHQAIKREIISMGILNANLVHPREVFEPAVKHLACQLMVAHNHPSGDPEPSDADLEITRRLARAGDILGIELIDHVIVTSRDFFSFKEKKLL